MFVIGIDVVILAAYALSLAAGAKIATELMHLDTRKGDGITIVVLFSTMMMVAGYVAMAWILDRLAG